jgi:hypothetical protein
MTRFRDFAHKARDAFTASPPAAVAALSVCGVFVGLWLTYGLGPALTVCSGVAFACVGFTQLRGGYSS